MSEQLRFRRSILTIFWDFNSRSRLFAGRHRTTTLTHSPPPSDMAREEGPSERGDEGGRSGRADHPKGCRRVDLTVGGGEGEGAGEGRAKGEDAG